MDRHKDESSAELTISSPISYLELVATTAKPHHWQKECSIASCICSKRKVPSGTNVCTEGLNTDLRSGGFKRSTFWSIWMQLVSELVSVCLPCPQILHALLASWHAQLPQQLLQLPSRWQLLLH